MKTIRVYPSSKLSELEYLPGVPADGADLPEDEANRLLDAGLAVKTKPRSNDDEGPFVAIKSGRVPAAEPEE